MSDSRKRTNNSTPTTSKLVKKRKVQQAFEIVCLYALRECEITQKRHDDVEVRTVHSVHTSLGAAQEEADALEKKVLEEGGNWGSNEDGGIDSTYTRAEIERLSSIKVEAGKKLSDVWLLLKETSNQGGGWFGSHMYDYESETTEIVGVFDDKTCAHQARDNTFSEEHSERRSVTYDVKHFHLI